MRKTKDVHLKLDLSTAASLDRYAASHNIARNRLMNEAIETYLHLQNLHRLFLQYQELGCDLSQFRADYCQFDLGALSWLMQND